MAIKAVNNWLNGAKDYTEGVRLYKQYGSSTILADLFTKSQNIYTEKKLLQELQKINEQSAPVLTPVMEVQPKLRQKDLMRLSTFKPKQKSTFAAVDLTNAPKALQNLDQRRRQLFQQAAEVKAALDAGTFKTDAERYEAVKLIDENFYGFKGIQQIWQRIDYWKRFGRFVPFQAKKPTKPVALEVLHKRLTTVRTYISKYKNNKSRQDLYHKYTNEALEIEQKILDNGEA